MYIAKIRTKKGISYRLRESVKTNDLYESRDVCDLGPSPGAWIDYPGGNAFHVCTELQERVENRAREFNSDHLEDLFIPFLIPSVRRATEAFRNRSSSKYVRTTREEKERLSRTTHAFDKRRAHFLKFGNLDQGPIVNFPSVLFKPFKEKSRDEIEQWFMAQERQLTERELKSYVFTIFDLQRFFQGLLAKKMPQALDQDRVEAHFLKEICRLNQDLFSLTSHLNEYMVRYLIMFFDFTYDDSVLLDDMANEFMFRHRSRRPPPPPKPAVSAVKAREVFGLTKEEFKTLDKRGLTRKYRKLARKHHPDTGGDHDTFVALNDAYQSLLEKLSSG